MRKSSAKAALGGVVAVRLALSACVATTALLISAGDVSLQDIGDLTGVSDKKDDRWMMRMVTIPMGSKVVKAPDNNGSNSKAEIQHTLAVRTAGKTEVLQLPSHVSKKTSTQVAVKGDRVVSAKIAAERFDIGETPSPLLQSHSMFLNGGLDSQELTAQADYMISMAHRFHGTPDIAPTSEVQIAAIQSGVMRFKLPFGDLDSAHGITSQIASTKEQPKLVFPLPKQTAQPVVVAKLEAKTELEEKGQPSVSKKRVKKRSKTVAAKKQNKKVVAATKKKNIKVAVANVESAKPITASTTTYGTPSPLVSAYAPAEDATQKNSPFDAVLRPTLPKERPILKGIKKAFSKFKISLGKNDHKWALNPLPRSSYSAAQRRCLAVGIYFEARGEPIKGQQAVAQVILNRVKNPAYPRTVCGVVYQNQRKRNRCQFSFACDGIKDRIKSKKHWRIAKKVANDAIEGKVWLKRVGSASHYHADYVRPRWRRSMKRRIKIGRHIFYRTYGGGWS